MKQESNVKTEYVKVTKLNDLKGEKGIKPRKIVPEMVVWETLEEVEEGIHTVALHDNGHGNNIIVGYNGYLIGDKVIIDGKEEEIVVVSRLGYMRTSETGMITEDGRIIKPLDLPVKELK